MDQSASSTETEILSENCLYSSEPRVVEAEMFLSVNLQG